MNTLKFWQPGSAGTRGQQPEDSVPPCRILARLDEQPFALVPDRPGSVRMTVHYGLPQGVAAADLETAVIAIQFVGDKEPLPLEHWMTKALAPSSVSAHVIGTPVAEH